MEYYDEKNPFIYHLCAACSGGKAIAAEDRRPGREPAAMLCAECRNRVQSRTCEEARDGSEEQGA